MPIPKTKLTKPVNHNRVVSVELAKPSKPINIEEVVITYDKQDKRKKQFDEDYKKQYIKYQSDSTNYVKNLVDRDRLQYNDSLAKAQKNEYANLLSEGNADYKKQILGLFENPGKYGAVSKPGDKYYNKFIESFTSNEPIKYNGYNDELTKIANRYKNQYDTDYKPSKIKAGVERPTTYEFDVPKEPIEPVRPTKKILKYDSSYDKFTTKPLWATE